MVKPSRARFIEAEKSSRLVGLVFAIGALLWEGISRLGEHIVLGWIAERIQGQEFMVSLLYWSVDHPILFFGALVILHLAYVSLRIIFGPDEDGGMVDRDKNITSGPQSPISTGDNSPAIGSVAAGKDAYIGGTHFHAQQSTRDAPEVRLIFTQFSSRVAFAVENRSLVRDAENVTAELINSDGFELYFEPVPLLARSSNPMELACKSFRDPSGERINAGIVRFAIAWAGSTGTEDGQPINFDLRLLFSDPFAKYSRIVHISSSWPAFGLAQSTGLDHESIRTVPLEA